MGDPSDRGAPPITESIAFRDQLLGTYRQGQLHVILDNVIVHRSKEVQAWHAKPRHQRVAFPTKKDLVEKILAYIERFNQEGRPFQWTKAADEILRSLTKLTRH